MSPLALPPQQRGRWACGARDGFTRWTDWSSAARVLHRWAGITYGPSCWEHEARRTAVSTRRRRWEQVVGWDAAQRLGREGGDLRDMAGAL